MSPSCAKKAAVPGKAAAAPEAEQLLRSMRHEDRPDCQPEHGWTEERHDAIVSPFMPAENCSILAHTYLDNTDLRC